MENLAQLAQDAQDCEIWARNLQQAIEGGGEIAKCIKYADALSRKAGKLNRVFCALQNAIDSQEEK